ncbi:MAG: hypothetical protein M3552_01710 [Planctomycetota bacterium]|nr:hypothetical protein [Planctomycetaceae bacterium]MDQ3329363.1 hypothetical protein [Planctomycetota bacterium]
MPSRRAFLATSAAAMAGSLLPRCGWGAEPTYQANVPLRVITQGPRHHWFGYYDKWQFDPNDRFVLSNEVPFEHRSPTESDVITVGYVDLEDGDTWTSIGESRAWGWQQGCMLQWVPNTASTVIWNDRDGDRFVSRILDVKSGVGRTLPHAIYTLSPDGKTAITTDFRRLNELRPGYGYSGIDDPNRDVMRPDDVGIWSVDLASGDAKLIIPVAQAAAIGEQTPDMADGKHYFNHLLFNTDGTRFIFLHRWRPDRGRGNFRTRMFTANADGSDLYVLDSSGETSHFIWRDPQHVCAWTKPAGKPAGFYLFKDQTDEITPVGPGVMTVNGHNTYLPVGEIGEWILNDTYPDKDRMQTVYLYHVPIGKRTDLGRFPSPPAYTGEWRCDTHPRYSHSGKLVCIDSPHESEGRQLHLADVSEIVS